MNFVIDHCPKKPSFYVFKGQIYKTEQISMRAQSHNSLIGVESYAVDILKMCKLKNTDVASAFL